LAIYHPLLVFPFLASPQTLSLLTMGNIQAPKNVGPLPQIRHIPNWEHVSMSPITPGNPPWPPMELPTAFTCQFYHTGLPMSSVYPVPLFPRVLCNFLVTTNARGLPKTGDISCKGSLAFPFHSSTVSPPWTQRGQSDLESSHVECPDTLSRPRSAPLQHEAPLLSSHIWHNVDWHIDPRLPGLDWHKWTPLILLRPKCYDEDPDRPTLCWSKSSPGSAYWSYECDPCQSSWSRHWGRGPLETGGNMSGTLKGQELFTCHVSTRHISGTCVMSLAHFPYMWPPTPGQEHFICISQCSWLYLWPTTNHHISIPA